MVEHAWTRADQRRAVERSKAEPTEKWLGFHGGNRRKTGGKMARFVGAGHRALTSQQQAELRPDHPALTNATTIFLKSRRDPAGEKRVLKSGRENAKTGGFIAKGPWAGMPIFTLTLEERATCPPACELWAACYGNAMPFARRHEHGDALELRLAQDLVVLCKEHGRIAVRLHVLGDFYSEHYVKLWRQALADLPGLHIWGYTHHPLDSGLGRLLAALNVAHTDRCSIRFSVPPDAAPAPMTATTIWRKPEGSVVTEGQVCPAQTEATMCCGTCGLCWEPDMADRPIVFTGHGMSGGRKKAAGQGELV